MRFMERVVFSLLCAKPFCITQCDIEQNLGDLRDLPFEEIHDGFLRKSRLL